MIKLIRLEAIIIIYIALLSYGCSREKNHDILVNSFPETIYLSGNPIQKINVVSKGNVRMSVVDTFLIIQKKEEKYLQFYSTNTFELLSEIGSRGRGPGEFLSPELIRQVDYDDFNKSPIIYVYDYQRRRLTHINIIDNINNCNINNKQEILPDVNTFILYFYYKNDSLFFCSPETEGRFLFYDYKKSKIKIIPYLPKLKFQVKNSRLPLVYRSACCVNNERRIIAAAPIFLGEIDFFDLKGNYIKSTIFEPRNSFKKEITIEDKFFAPKNQIVDLVCKEGLIYGLNYNNNDIELYANRTKNFSNLKIQVFNWDGQPIKEYILDNRFIMSFAVDLTHNRIYGYCPDELEHSIILYNLD